MIQAIILSCYYKILEFDCYEGMFIILVVEFIKIIALLFYKLFLYFTNYCNIVLFERKFINSIKKFSVSN